MYANVKYKAMTIDQKAQLKINNKILFLSKFNPINLNAGAINKKNQGAKIA
jgi:hypothetical protein